MISFSVRDTGIGIPGDKLEMIFEAFQQADGTTSRKYGGTGLGLSISKELARMLGGKIEVSSEVGARVEVHPAAARRAAVGHRDRGSDAAEAGRRRDAGARLA